MKTRILMFGWEFPPHHSGGLGVACFGLTRALSVLGSNIIFVMPKKMNVDAPWAEFIFADAPHLSARVVASNLTPYETSTIAWQRKSQSYGGSLFDEVESYARSGKEIALSETFDIIYAHDWLSFGAGIVAKKATGKPLVVHVHATEYDRGGGAVNKLVYDIEKEGMLEADAVIAVSDFTKRIIVEQYYIPESKVHVVHNGIDDSTMPRGSSDLPRLRLLKSAGYKLVLFLGRLTLQKGPDYFIKVAERVRGHNDKVKFIMAGSGDMEAQMLDMVARLGLTDTVLFAGFVEGAERHEMYSVADLFIMPSVSEPFGITPLEAMKLGTPVLISKQSGVSEVVSHALKADFWDVEEMANQILSVLKNPAIGTTIAAHARTEADLLTWSDTAKKVDNVLQEVLRSRIK